MVGNHSEKCATSVVWQASPTSRTVEDVIGLQNRKWSSRTCPRLIARSPSSALLNHSAVGVCAVRAKICVCQARQCHTPPWICSKYQEPPGPISRSHTASTPLHSSTHQHQLCRRLQTRHDTSEHIQERFKNPPPPPKVKGYFSLIIFELIHK